MAGFIGKVFVTARLAVSVTSKCYAFQACSIDHSDVSPFRIYNLQNDAIGL